MTERDFQRVVVETAKAAPETAKAAHQDARPHGRGSGRLLFSPALLYAPPLIFLGLFFIIPLTLIAWMSFTEPAPGFGNYVKFFSSPRALGILAETVLTAGTVTICALFVAYPVAYVAATRNSAFGNILLLIVALSFWTNFLVRTYAWMVIFSNNGPAQAALAAFGWNPPPRLLYTSFASTLAMTQMLTPLMVFMLYAVMRRIDGAYLQAAGSLGATPARAFLTVFLPLSAPGIINGVTLVFITCMGFYVTPILIGSPRDMMISGLIAEQMEQFLDFGGASASSMILLVFTLVLFSVYNAFFDIEKIWRR
ncbi:ABC transporter permease [Mesorhizobium sp. L-8-10]|uniref:ABC transporter permease n=1 Tax=Mesorhizobium sp. L-8-10 TaxID=2744523 RepID=UPI0019255F47|nr:ABC transporter permease [Mesorhizobium sp. L-8-10]